MLRTVQTESGWIKGLVGKDPRVTVFRGVPYAKPPVGELRWKAPQKAEPWEGVRNCYEYGPMPMMRFHPGLDDAFYTKELHPTSAEYDMSEDCLYLNIFSPAETTQDNLPVFCYIHGGGLQDGYNYEVEFDGERLARRGVIVVMVSYRLGLFGFLAHPELTAETPDGEVVSNFGLQDQSFALHWVANNIRNFGGDPSRITICGQSAGSASVQAQLCSPLNEGIIAGAICQSSVTMSFGEASRFGRSTPLAEAEAQGEKFFRDVGIRDLAEARSLPARDLMDRLIAVSPKGSMFGLVFGVCLDGKFVTEPLGDSYYNANLPKVPMMVGHCQGEATGGMFARRSMTLAEFEAYAEVYGERKEEFLALANCRTDEDVAALYKGPMNGMIGGSIGFCELRSRTAPVWYFVFDHDIPGDDAGSFHGSDLWFMFDSLGNSWRPFEGRHYDLARQVASYWVNFVKYGNPNGEGVDYIGKPLPEWKPYTKDDKACIRFEDEARPITVDASPVIDFRLSFGESVHKK